MSEVPLPWKVGDALPEGWTVADLHRHAEFVRVRATRGDEETGFEVIFHDGAPNAWATPRYRLQPALGADPPPVELLAGVLDTLKAVDDGGGEPFVKRVRVEREELHVPLTSTAPDPEADQVLQALRSLELDDED